MNDPLKRALTNPLLLQGAKLLSTHGLPTAPESGANHILCDTSSSAGELFTSSFRVAGRHPKAVAISRGVPVWFRGRRYHELEPTAEMLGIRDLAVFTRAYTQQLAKLDPHAVAQDLGHGAIMLCWEPPEKACHRQLVADWLRETGVRVSEWPLPTQGEIR